VDQEADSQSGANGWRGAEDRARAYASAARTYWVSRPTFLQRVIAGAVGLVLLGLLVIILASALVVGSVFALVFFVAMGLRRLVDALVGRTGAKTPGDSLRRNVRVVRTDGR